MTGESTPREHADDLWPAPSLPTGLGRALSMRCPRCGSRGLFKRWIDMVDDCPQCAMHFERSPGYWLGSMVFSLGATIVVFLGVFLGGLVLTWPDVPYSNLMIVLIALMVITPLFIQPFARTLWVALERHVRSRSEPYQ